MTLWTALYRRRSICEAGIFFEPGIVHNDTSFTYEALCSAKRAGYLKAKLYRRRVRPGSIITSGDHFRSAYSFWRVGSAIDAVWRKLPPEAGEEMAWYSRRRVALAYNAARQDYRKCSEYDRGRMYALLDDGGLFRKIVAEPVWQEEERERLAAEKDRLTEALRQQAQGGASLDDLLPEAFAACREASWRVLGMKHFKVQIEGGIVLHQGRIAEMKTGEGKTLVATLPAYLNALTGEGVHIVTVNDYLAKRDSEWMGKIFRYLGLTVGLIIHEKTNEERKAAYAADITYGTNNEMGFDYLRDNMVIYAEQRVQRGHVFAIVDEVDSILIDEARTPLIISGRGDKK